MVELDSDKWLLVKIACDNMAANTTDPAMQASYEWLVDVATHNAQVALAAEQFDTKAQALIDRERPYDQRS